MHKPIAKSARTFAIELSEIPCDPNFGIQRAVAVGTPTEDGTPRSGDIVVLRLAIDGGHAHVLRRVIVDLDGSNSFRRMTATGEEIAALEPGQQYEIVGKVLEYRLLPALADGRQVVDTHGSKVTGSLEPPRKQS